MEASPPSCLQVSFISWLGTAHILAKDEKRSVGLCNFLNLTQRGGDVSS